MGKPAPRRRENAGSLVAARDIVPLDQAWREGFIADASSNVPLRALLEKRSDFGFLDEVARRCDTFFADLTVSDPSGCAEAATALVVAEPAVCMYFRTPGNDVRVVHAVCGRTGGDDATDILLVVRARIVPTHFGETGRTIAAIHDLEVKIDVVDCNQPADMLALAEQVADWSAEHSVSKPQDLRGDGTVLLLGDLTALCIGATPADWREQFERLVLSFGLNPVLVGQGSKFSGSAPSDTILAVEFDPYGGTPPTLPARIVPVVVAPHTRTFASVKEHLCDLVLDAMERDDEAGDVVLRPGDRIFHRKIGSGRHFDSFNEGSAKACKHGESAFEPWSGDKCVKGFQRMYSNFEPPMLRHCKHYPNCGMYAVFA